MDIIIGNDNEISLSNEGTIYIWMKYFIMNEIYYLIVRKWVKDREKRKGKKGGKLNIWIIILKNMFLFLY